MIMIICPLNIKIFPVFLAVLFLFQAGGVTAGQNVVSIWNRPERCIVLDPGHGGHDVGAIGAQGTFEKNVTLTLARRAAAQLSPRYKVLLTRTGDYQVEIADRVAMANHNHADLYLSLHTGGGFSMQYGGVNLYFLNEMVEQSRSSASFSVKEMEAERPCIRWREANYSHHRLCKSFANIMEQTCRTVIESSCRVRGERMAVLQGADMPAVMIEIGCMTNPSWEKQFRNPERIAVFTKAIVEAVERFFQSDRPIDADHVN